MINNIYNDDCFSILPKIENKTVDLVLVDLPYGQTACEWDVKIDLQMMWKELKRICKDNCQYVFFTTTKFGIELINSNPKWFRYDLVWDKCKKIGHLSANRMPLRCHEMIYIFNNSGEDDLDLTRNLELREYAKNILKFINKPYRQIEKDLGNMRAQHFLMCATSTQFSLPTKETYDTLVEMYKINEMQGFRHYEELQIQKINYTYNPQKTPGKPYKVKGQEIIKDVYGQTRIPTHENKTGDRYPSSIITFHQSGEKLHRTQKPLELCEWLIKTYSNDNDVVLDFCMGSGTTIQACINTNRRYIGVEKDKDIYETAKKRLNI